ncbi:tetratricopeptide (TPR) repeat protein [Rhodoblastus sphagnicola]|nr:tetratricopeptide repeat-containing glycosyltransferase family protein [Rhodoblastus sphagnicola]MBB4199337.1 tetratricopeptide (TPR) repeat protein [Rhodoblastus sphagnicola]
MTLHLGNAAIRSDNDAADDLYQAGLREQAAGRLDAAIALFDRAMSLRPEFPEALCSGGYILQTKGHAAAALAFYDRALSLKPDYAVAWFNRGCLLMAHKNYEAALESFDQACALKPGDANFYCNRGAALVSVGRAAEAAEDQKRALALKPDFIKAALNLGNALMRLGAYAGARDAYRRAIELKADYASGFAGLGIALKELGQFSEALEAFDEALRLEPDSDEALANKGCLQLLLGNFAAGWEGYEHRWFKGQRLTLISSAKFDLRAPATLAGRKILVVNDHGLGDTIQFFRYIVLLAEAGAEVTFACPAKMWRLLDSSGAKVAWRDDKDQSGDFDATLSLSSLPRACETRLETIPAPAPYLRAEPDRVAHWRARMSGEGVKIGLCWSGSSDFRVDPRRSIPPVHLAPLAELPNARFFSLQKEDVASPFPKALEGRLIRFDGIDSGPDAFIDTAAIMANLDLVVTCDTSIAHLAGALGRPVWVALKHIPEWRWMHARADSPWYPTMRLFRCADGDDWTALFNEMTPEIRRKFPG